MPNYIVIALPEHGRRIDGNCSTLRVVADSPEDAAKQSPRAGETKILVADLNGYYTHAYEIVTETITAQTAKKV